MSDANGVNEDEDACPICFDDLKSQGQKRLLRSSEGIEMLDCGHPFCHTCIRTYVSKAIKDGETSSGKIMMIMMMLETFIYILILKSASPSPLPNS